MSKSEIEKLNTRCAAIELVLGALLRLQLDERQRAELYKAISDSTQKYGDPYLSALATKLGAI